MYWLWDPNPVAVVIGGFAIGWYGLLFALGFLLAQRLVIFMYHKERKPGRDLDALLIYLIVGTVVGARVGHCLFYDPLYYLRNPLLVFKVWEGGLASHGAAIGLLAAVFLFSQRKKDQPFLWLADRIAIVAALVGGLVRLGNFINSEIVGFPTRGAAGVVFLAPIRAAVGGSDPSFAGVEIRRIATSAPTTPGSVPLRIRLSAPPGIPPPHDRRALLHQTRTALFADPAARIHLQVGEPLPEPVDTANMSFNVTAVARHPVQLYEADVYLTLAAVLFLLWWRRQAALPHGLLLGWLLLVVFASRFFLEYFKEPVAPIEAQLPLAMGQLLSIPFVLTGLWLIVKRRHQPPLQARRSLP